MAHEGARRLFLGIVDDVMGKTLLHYDAVPHEKHAVGSLTGESHLVRDDDHAE